MTFIGLLRTRITILFHPKVSYREKTTKRDQVIASLVLLADFVGKDKGHGYMCGSDRNAFIRSG